MILSVARICRKGWWDGMWMVKNSEGSGRGLIEVLSQCLPGGTEENDENLDRIGCVPIEIRTQHFPNASIESYRCPNSLSNNMLKR
jgi:hypothetical protein